MSFPSLSDRQPDSSLPVFNGGYSSIDIGPAVIESQVSVKQCSRAVPASALLIVVSTCLLGWGAYSLLASIHVFAVIFNEVALINWKAILAIGAGALVAFIGVVIAIVAVVRSRPKTIAVIILLCGLALPAIAAMGSGYLGVAALKAHTFVEARDYVGKVEPEQVDAVLTEVEKMGVAVPWHQDLVVSLRTEKGAAS